jgi:hypothetical protein
MGEGRNSTYEVTTTVDKSKHEIEKNIEIDKNIMCASDDNTLLVLMKLKLANMVVLLVLQSPS